MMIIISNDIHIMILYSYRRDSRNDDNEHNANISDI